MEKIIAQAAEAIIIRQDDKIIKRRVKKGYRIEILDEKLRKLRTRSEAKLLEKAASLIPVPELLNVNEKTKEIEMQFIEGKKLSETLDSLKNRFEIMHQVGEETAKLHDNDIIHGDLTTSNMILVENNENKSYKQVNDSIEQSSKRLININSKKCINNSEMPEQEEGMKESRFKVYLIDFGLGFISKRIEDKACDLHLIKQALEAKHFQNHDKLFSAFIEGYNPKEKSKILEQLKKVEARGRYKKNAS